ncbi:hypothetical protein [Serratia nevei]|uniref:hypothetical protein n=1 Tax=Serratia nevei TaxID=2703794 RepID=UPI00313DBDC2
MLTGMLPGVVLCAALGAALKDNVADAATETFLAAQDITLSGKVTAPSCTVKLENDRMTFSRQQDNRETASQTLRLNLSQCEADGVGVTFKAEHWPDNPVRGTLSGAQSRQREEGWYYTLSPGTDSGENGEAEWPMRLADDSPALQKDKQASGDKSDVYFSLAEVNYWYDLKAPMKEGDVRVIPFQVQVHQDITKERQGTHINEALESTFTLQISWR